MADDSKMSGQEVQFPLNKRLLEESSKIREERKVIKERLKKIESTKPNVSEKVYERVRSDYLAQLNTNTDQLLEKKQDIDKELATLYEAKKKVSENVAVHKEKLEELNFRFGLGEFPEADFHKLANEENSKLGKFEKILSAIESNIDQYESLFEGEAEFFEEGPSVKEETPPSEEHLAPEAPISTDDDYNVGHDGDYFGPNTEEVPNVPHEAQDIGEATSKEITIPIDEASEETFATITILAGDNKGDVYKISKNETGIGRASSNDIVLKEAKVSRQHSIIKRQGQEYLIEDLHSSNGVFVNDEKIKEHALSNGDIIKIGDFVMKFTG